jgi:hypothetical protein
MNDGFLTRYRKSPPREFSEALYKRIKVQMNPRKRFPFRRLTFAAALCAALVTALAFSPAVQAAFNGLIVEIGGMTFFEPDETESQATPLPESQVTIVPQEILPLAEAQARLPYDIRLPTWVPDGFKMGTSVRVAHFPGFATPEVTITWYGSDPDVGNIDLTIYGQRVNWLVETDNVQEVEVNGQPAALVEGGWDADTNQWSGEAARMLNWMKGSEMYQLHSPGASAEDLIRMAESIP